MPAAAPIPDNYLLAIRSVLSALIAPYEGFACVSDGQASLESLHARERVLARRMAPARRRQFAAGRDCARQALGACGIAARPILVETDGAPRWPAGIIGSISHTVGASAAVVSWDPRLHGIGIDLEMLRKPFSQVVAELVFLPEELAGLRSMTTTMRNEALYSLFAAKEATFKAVRHTTDQSLGWEDICIELNIDTQQFRPLVLTKDFGTDYTLRGRTTIVDRIITSVCLVVRNRAQ